MERRREGLFRRAHGARRRSADHRIGAFHEDAFRRAESELGAPMMLWTAFILGLVGSAHCAGMCGPLALALPPTGRSRAAFLTGRVAYNLGRVVTYASLGALFGLLGRTLALAGFQRWVSLLAGAVILISVLLSPRPASGVLLVRVVNWLKASF